MTAPPELPAGPPPAASTHGDCANCGTPLLGEHCYACGQPVKGMSPVRPQARMRKNSSHITAQTSQITPKTGSDAKENAPKTIAAIEEVMRHD